MRKMRLFFTLLVLLVSSAAVAQEAKVTGKVTDSATGDIVPFASIQIKGTMTGTSSDAEGNYSISVPSPDDAILIFSFVGYKDAEVPVQGRAKIDVQLKADTEALEETVVIAFGKTTKEAFTGSAAVVKSSDIAKVQTSNATRALEGVVAGVQMTTSSGALGASPQIRIRGTSSISADSSPLYIVDGVPFSGDINNINSADIESMTVLKDAASNALYGSRGANGVIMITTKKARKGEAVVTLEARIGANTKAMQDYEYITDPGMYYEAHYGALKSYYMDKGGLSDAEAHLRAAMNVAGPAKNGGLGYNIYTVPEGQLLIGSNGKINPAAELGRIVEYKGMKYKLMPDNWLDNVYSPSLRQEYNLNISGGTERASFYGSIGMLDNKGIIPNAKMRRYTAKFKTDYEAKSWLKVGMNASYARFNWLNASPNESSDNGSVFGIATGMAPIYPLYLRDENGNIMYDDKGFKRYDFGNGVNAGLDRPNATGANPLATQQLDRAESLGNAFNGTGYIEVRFLKHFSIIVNAGIGLQEWRTRNMSNPYYGQFVTNGGNITVGHNRTTSFNTQQLINFNRTFADKHGLDILLGHEFNMDRQYKLSASKTKLFSIDNLELNGAVVDSKASQSYNSSYNNEGYFARVQYDFDKRIYASASYRRDASSRFHPNHRWGDFWSVGAGWLINHERWFNAPWVDMLKIKASIGSQGNDNIGDYLYTDTYSVTNSNEEIGINFAGKGNENITWETNTNFNAGVDFGFFGGRLNGTVEYFYRKTSDMLFWFTVPQSLGYSGYYDNVGDMRNAGVEFSIDGSIFANRNFTWNIFLNGTHFTNKIIYLPEKRKITEMEGYKGYANGQYFYGEGLPLYTFKMPKYAGVDKKTGLSTWYKDVKDEAGNITRTTTTEYSEATDYLCEAPTPKLYGGFGTSFSFYGVDLSVQFTYQLGGLSIDSGYMSSMNAPGGSTGSSFHKDIYKSWSRSNPDSDIPRFQYLDENQNATSDRFLTNASYLNFQNAQIGYTFPSKLTEKIKIHKIRIYASADNIWYVSARKGFDPRFSFNGTTSSVTNSTVRTISGGISITF